MRYTIVIFLLFVFNAEASELNYSPVNPNFGGNPLNGSLLLGNAQAQNNFKDPQASAASQFGSGQKSSLQQFNENLQQAVLSRVASAVTGGITDANGKLIPGTITTADFTITVANLGGGLLSITTVETLTGATTVFQIKQ